MLVRDDEIQRHAGQCVIFVAVSASVCNMLGAKLYGLAIILAFEIDAFSTALQLGDLPINGIATFLKQLVTFLE